MISSHKKRAHAREDTTTVPSSTPPQKMRRFMDCLYMVRWVLLRRLMERPPPKGKKNPEENATHRQICRKLKFERHRQGKRRARRQGTIGTAYHATSTCTPHKCISINVQYPSFVIRQGRSFCSSFLRHPSLNLSHHCAFVSRMPMMHHPSGTGEG